MNIRKLRQHNLHHPIRIYPIARRRCPTTGTSLPLIDDYWLLDDIRDDVPDKRLILKNMRTDHVVEPPYHHVKGHDSGRLILRIQITLQGRYAHRVRIRDTW